MCLETGVVTEGEPESLSGDGQNCLSTPFIHNSVKDVVYSSPSEVDTNIEKSSDEKSISLSDVNAINQHDTRPSTSANSSDDENRQNIPVLKYKKNKLCKEKKCTLCDKVFIDLHEYTLHLKEEHRSNKNQLHICNICDKKLSSASSLDRHLLVHTGERPHKCEICNLTFTTNGNMNRHMRTHDKRKFSKSKIRRAMKKQKDSQYSGPKLSISSTEEESMMEAQTSSHTSGRKTSISSTEEESMMEAQTNSHTSGRKTFFLNTEEGSSVKRQNNSDIDNKPFVSNTDSPVKIHKNDQFSNSKTLVLSSESGIVKNQKNDHCKEQKTSVFSTESLNTMKKRKNDYYSDSKTLVSSNDGDHDAKKKKNNHCSESKTSASTTEGKNEVKNVHECSDCIPGFGDLTLMGFSSKHFPLLARLECEKRRRCPPDNKINLNEINQNSLDNSNLPKVCDICEFRFPCQRSLDLHLMAHFHKKSLFCKICRTGFSSNLDFAQHELMHETTMHNDKNSKQNDKLLGLVHRTEQLHKDNYMSMLGLFNSKTMNHRISFKNEEPSTTKNMKEKLQKDLSNKTSITDKEILIINSKPDCQTDSSNDFADISSIVSLTSKSSIPNIRASPITATPASPQCGDQIPASPQSCVQFSETCQNLRSNDVECFHVVFPSTSQSKDEIPVAFPKESASLLQVSGSEIENHNLCSDLNTQNNVIQHTMPKHFKSSKAKKYSKKTLHKCPKCDYTSLDKSTLSRHMRTHNGERPFKCSICDYAFTTKANTHRHVRHRHHIPCKQAYKYAVYNSSKCRTKSSGNGVSDSTHKVYCQFCKKGFDNSRVLQHHLRSTSSSCPRKPYFCRMCNSGFTTKNNCNRHIINQHPDFNVNQLIHINKSQLKNKKIDDSEVQDEQILNLADNEASSNDETEQLSISLENVEEESNNQENLNETTSIEMEKSPTKENETDIATLPIYSEMVCENLEQNSKVHSDQIVHQILDHTEFSTSLEYSETVHKKLNTSDEVFALHGLMQLSEVVPLQRNDDFDDQPLDLSVRPVDLSTKKSNIQHCASNEHILRLLPNVPLLKNTVLSKPQPAHTSTFIPKVLNSSQTLNNEAINLCKISISSPSPIFPTQHSTPYYNAIKSVNRELHKTEEEIFNKKTSPKKDIECQYCSKKFSNKSNKERHIKKQHPERTLPSRNNFPSATAIPELQKQCQNVSDITKNRLRSVLIPKVTNNNNNQIPYDDDEDSSRSETALCIVENMNTDSSNESDPSEDSFLKSVSKSDYENNDLASVSSVIDTANSQEISRFLKDVNFTDHAPKTQNIGGKSNMIRNTSGKNKHYRCDFCEQTFSSSSARERHMTTHTGERNFECTECGSRFTTKSNRDRHEKRKCCSKNNYRLKIWHSTLSDTLESLESTSKDMNCDDNNNKHTSLSEFNKIDQLQNVDNRLSHLHQNLFNPSFENGYHLNTAMYVPLQSITMKPELECKICNNTYKNSDDLTNHMKELHPLEYKSLMGEAIHPEDTILSLKKSGLKKKKIF